MVFIPGTRLGASVELLKIDPETREEFVIYSSDPCPRCFRALSGAVVNSEDGKIHMACLTRRIGE